MISFFKTGLRTLKREKFFTLINLIGLSIGMFCFLVTALYVRDEVTYDRWHQNADNIYMSTMKLQREDGEPFDIRTSSALMEVLKEESSGLLEAVSISVEIWSSYQVNDEWVRAPIVSSSPELFQVFDFGLKFGNKELALTDPSQVIISAEIAESLFPGINPVGETVTFRHEVLKVGGVLNPIPKNSHLRFDFITAMTDDDPIYDSSELDWLTGGNYSYFLLKEGYDGERLLSDAKRILARQGITNQADGLNFLKFADLYLDGKTGRYDNENLFGGQRKYLYIFSLVGGLILFVACFNYINLTTARSFSKVKQMGIRKVMGASRNRLVISLMGETFALAFCALVIAIIGLELLLPFAQPLIGKELEFNFLNAPQLILLPFSVLILVVLISGIYPALTLSSFNISGVLRGNLPQSKVSFLRKSLFVLQFTICSGLLITALVIRGQANYLIELDKGFNEENIMSMSLYQESQKLDYQTVRNSLEAIPQIENVTLSPLPQFLPAPPSMLKFNGLMVPITINSGAVDLDFNDLFELEILEGGDFKNIPMSALDSVAIINETAKKKLGLNPAIGAKMPDGKTVVGVVKDFHYTSAKQVIEPAELYYNPKEFHNVQFSYRVGDREAVKGQVALALNKMGVKAAPNLQEIKGYFAYAYKREAQLVTIFDLLTGLVIVVAFLGLFALSSFENKLREKEIGIRKVLGATYLNLIQTLNKRFTWLIALAVAVAVPITKYGVDQWLSDFPYRQDSLNPYFISAIVIVGFIAFSVLGLHSYFSAQKNPVDVLRNE
jgi:putative ABC transport system permease protein